MITLHIRDTQGIYTGSVEVDPMGPIPRRSVAIAPPELTGTQVARWNGNGWEVLAERPPLPCNLVAASAALISQIDSDADAIYFAVLGNRMTEYPMAEQDAQAFKDAGYTGDVPESVQDWADVKGETAQWAADNVLATASLWRNAQLRIRKNRLARKEDARAASNQADIDAASATWADFVTVIRAELGL